MLSCLELTGSPVGAQRLEIQRSLLLSFLALDLPTLLIFFFVAFYYCMSTVAFIFDAFYMPYKTIQTIPLWELFVFTRITASLCFLFLPHFLLLPSTRYLALLWEPVQHSVKSTDWVQILTPTYWLCGLGPVSSTSLCFVFLTGKMKIIKCTFSSFERYSYIFIEKFSNLAYVP